MGPPAAAVSGIILHQEHPAVRFGIVRRHAAVIDTGCLTPSSAKSGARDLEGRQWNAREGSKLSGLYQFETLVLSDQSDKLRRANISRHAYVPDVRT